MFQFIKRNALRVLPYALVLGLALTVIHLVRANYVWVGFQQKDYYTDLQVAKGEAGRLQYQLSEMQEARNKFNEDVY